MFWDTLTALIGQLLRSRKKKKVTGIVLLPAANTVFLTGGGQVLGYDTAVSQGSFRFLKDHYIDGEYILAGEVREMSSPWVPTADVEPMDSQAVDFFYSVGPQLGGVIRTQFSNRIIYAPATYWKAIAPNLWALTGLGASKDPIAAILARVEDKEP